MSEQEKKSIIDYAADDFFLEQIQAFLKQIEELESDENFLAELRKEMIKHYG